MLLDLYLKILYIVNGVLNINSSIKGKNSKKQVQHCDMEHININHKRYTEVTGINNYWIMLMHL